MSDKNEVIGKRDICRAVASEYSNISIDDVSEIFSGIIKYINIYLEHGYKVVIPNLGAFDVKLCPARKRWNVHDQEYVEMPEHYRLSFNWPRRMRDRFNKERHAGKRPKWFSDNNIEVDDVDTEDFEE